MTLSLPEKCTAEVVARLWQTAKPEISRLQKDQALIVDADNVVQYDGACEALIVELYRRAQRQGFSITCQDRQNIVAHTLHVFDAKRFSEDPSIAVPRRNAKTAEQLGEATVNIWRDICGQMAFLGEVVVSSLKLLTRPKQLRLRDTLLHYERAGINALPIVLLIGFLLGLIVAFMAATAFKQFGVEIYVADLLAIGLFRELGPLITAIILAGRSGSAFAAEIGIMKVNEEVDALVTLGLPPVPFLAVPRIIAATLAMPILSMFSVLAGLLGGALVLLPIGIPSATYWQHIIAATTMTNVLIGLAKAVVFGLLVGLVGCSHGLQTGRTADAVGRAATAAVVGSLVLITVCDGIFAVLCFLLGI